MTTQTAGDTSDTLDVTAVPGITMRAYKYALDPTRDQIADLSRHAGASRWAFNHALAAKTTAHAEWRAQVDALITAGEPEAQAKNAVKVATPKKAGIQKALNAAKGDSRTWQPTEAELEDPTAKAPGLCPWWHEVSTYAFQSAFADADRAWDNWLASLRGTRAGRKVGYPRFKKKGRSRDSFRLHHDVKRPTIRPDGYRRLNLPRIGSVRLHDTAKPLVRALDKQGARIQSVTIARGAQRWYASVLVAFPAGTTMPGTRSTPTHAQRRAGTVGVDLGVSHLAALSARGTDGALHEALLPNPRHTTRGARRLAKAQRAFARTQRNSTRRKKAAATVARLHAETALRRASTTHTLTKALATTYAAVAIEDLAVTGMTRSAKGTKTKPGRNVAAKAGLNKAITDANFGEIRRQLAYKTAWYGSTLRLVGRFEPTSKTCSACGRRNPSLTLRDRTHHCPCGLIVDRDLNAARNIRVAASDPAAWAAAVARGNQETQNARGDGISPTTRKSRRQPSMKREGPAHLAGSPPGSDSKASLTAA